MRGPRAQRRGAALLIAITSIAILTAVAVDLAYNTRVSLQMAANARDELRATYLAKSGVAMSRLVLHFQQRLDQATGASNPAPANAAAQAATGLSMRLALRLWELVPVDSSMAALFLGGGADSDAAGVRPAALTAGTGGRGAAPAAEEAVRRTFGDVDGSFHATVEDEERKVNVRQFTGFNYQQFAQGMRLAQLVRDPRWDFLFDEDDVNGFRVGRKELFGALKDWEDEDETGDVFTGNPLKPFENGFGDENALYDRLADRYKAKNAPFDSLDELFMVAGVTDAFMAAFGDKLTIYPDTSATINVNTTDPQQLVVNALVMSDPQGIPQPALLDPAFLGKLQATLALLRPLPFLSITPQQFAAALAALGLKIHPVFLQASTGGQRNPFGDRSTTFHIRATGTAGEVRKTLDVIVTFDRRAEGLAQDQGRLLHWREE